MKNTIVVLAIVFFLAIAASVRASPIYQDAISTYAQIRHFGPVGQSFIAEDNHVRAKFWIAECNQHIAPSDYDIDYYLYEGTGADGTLLGSHKYFGLTDGYIGWIEFDVSEHALTIGNTYSVMLNNDNARWGFGFAKSDHYAGGHLILSQDPHNTFPGSELYDATFQIVPEPSSTALLLMGIAGISIASKGCCKPAGTVRRFPQ
jgi:hypothetical protein